MSNRVKFWIDGDKVCAIAPYIPTFPRKARGIPGADFDKPSKTWAWPATEQSAVEALLMEVYGEFDGCQNRVDVLVKLSDFGTRQRGFFGLGRQIANRGRDGQFYLGSDVEHVSGDLPEKLCTENPDMIGHNTAVILVKSVPEDLANRECQMHPGNVMGIFKKTRGASKGAQAVSMMKHSFSPGDNLPSTKSELSSLKHDLLIRLAEVQQAIGQLNADADAPF